MGFPSTFVPLFPVFASSIALFLLLNGPSDWAALWDQLVNPPADARHAIRGGPLQLGRGGEQQFREKIWREQQMMRDYAANVRQSLEVNMRDQKGRLAVVERLFQGLGLDQNSMGEVAELMVGMRMDNLEQYQQRLRQYADEHWGGQQQGQSELHGQFLEKSAAFVEQLRQIGAK